jgi:large subunit ribosomal protein L13e
LSSKAAKAESEEESSRRTQNKTPAKPTGKVPRALVVGRHGTGVVQRPGKGFSLGELSGVGLQSSLAAEWGLRVDGRRRSVHEGNVNLLKTWKPQAPPAKKAQKRVEPVEKLVKIERMVEEEAKEVKQKVSKAGKGAKKGAAKTEKVVKKKAAKPKAKPKKKAKK